MMESCRTVQVTFQQGLRFLAPLLFLLPLHSQAASWEADDAPPQFCLQNFNAYGPMYAPQIAQRTDRWTAELQVKPACAVVHLQEVWGTNHITQVEQALAPKYQISSPNRDSRIGVMSMVRGQIEATETHSFHINNQNGVLDDIRRRFDIKKAFHVMKTQVEGIDESLYLINTHLHPGSTVVRLTQIMDIFHWRQNHQDLKMILTGDFNSHFDSLEYDFIRILLQTEDAYAEAHQGYKPGDCTYCSENPLGWLWSSRVFDYVFFSNIGGGAKHLAVTGAQINLRGTTRQPYSDHYGLRAEFVWREGSAPEQAPIANEKRRTVLSAAYELVAKESSPDFAPYAEELAHLLAAAAY